MIDTLLQCSEHVRYAAIYSNGELVMQTHSGISNTSSDESDKYEELLVNPTLLVLATQRGNIDCGGLSYLLIRYGNFYQLVKKTATGHVSIAISADTDPMPVIEKILGAIERS